VVRACQFLVVATGAQFQSNVESSEEKGREGTKYHEFARQCYRFHSWKVEGGLLSIQAHLLLMLYTLLSGQRSDGIWMLNALISSSCTYLGLHENRELGIGEEERNVLFCAYVVDKIVGTKTGKPNVLKSADFGERAMNCVKEGVEGRRRRSREMQRNGEWEREAWKGILDWYLGGAL
jgi:hypothetical protein